MDNASQSEETRRQLEQSDNVIEALLAKYPNLHISQTTIEIRDTCINLWYFDENGDEQYDTLSQ